MPPFSIKIFSCFIEIHFSLYIIVQQSSTRIHIYKIVLAFTYCYLLFYNSCGLMKGKCVFRNSPIAEIGQIMRLLAFYDNFLEHFVFQQYLPYHLEVPVRKTQLFHRGTLLKYRALSIAIDLRHFFIDVVLLLCLIVK